MDAIPLLKVEEFGPFRIAVKEELRLVSQLVLALLFWQMEGFEASRLIASALGTCSDDEDDDENDEEDDHVDDDEEDEDVDDDENDEEDDHVDDDEEDD